MIPRNLSGRILEMAQKFPVISLTGPRQSGKTTLFRAIFPGHRYVSLENPDNLDFALSDPKRFLDTWSGQVIFDEAQRAPRLFNYLQERVDEARQARPVDDAPAEVCQTPARAVPAAHLDHGMPEAGTSSLNSTGMVALSGALAYLLSISPPWKHW